MRRSALALLCALMVTVVAPPVTLAQNPFGSSPTTPSLQTQPQDEPQAPSAAKKDGLSTQQTILILLAGAILLGGIAWAVVRDARSRAAAADDGHEEGREKARAEREAEHRRRKQQSRKKGKAAKQARRNNRPR